MYTLIWAAIGVWCAIAIPVVVNRLGEKPWVLKLPGLRPKHPDTEDTGND